MDEVTNAICFDMVVKQRDDARRQVETFEKAHIQMQRSLDERARRIEQLEAALRFYADHWQKQYHRDLDRVFWNFMNPDDGGRVARKALEGKDE